ncbi:MAG: hypothetical protein ACJAXJ_001776 [Colwellia sp.]
MFEKLFKEYMITLSIKWRIILGVTITSILSTIIAVTTITEIEKERVSQKIIGDSKTIISITGTIVASALRLI